MSHYNSFIVKFWTDEAIGQHRGQIQHVATRETVYFTSQNEMNEFIRSHLGPPPNNPEAAQEDVLSETFISSGHMGVPSEQV